MIIKRWHSPHLVQRDTYGKAAGEFAAWCEAHGIAHLRDVQPVHVAAYVEELLQRIAAPTVKLQLAGIRMLFDWLVVGQVMPMNPASAVRGPKHSVKKGKTPVLTGRRGAGASRRYRHIDHRRPA